MFDVVELHGSKAATTTVELVTDSDADLPSRLLGDPGRLRQVLGNLVSNALKFTARGHVLIEACQVKRDGNNAVVSIAVRDTGEGIPEQVIGRLFEPFTQADASTSRKHGGTGLGLALSKRIVEGMGGHIELRSQEGQGSTVTITLELAVDLSGPASSSGSTILQGCRCLVVDDNALVRASLGEATSRSWNDCAVGRLRPRGTAGGRARARRGSSYPTLPSSIAICRHGR